ncbi:MAG: formate dehydrogenase subunit gamma [Sphaerotilus sp.]|nr:formate dehydrogenase subunit gamma [Sphaerotilus sp.]
MSKLMRHLMPMMLVALLLVGGTAGAQSSDAASAPTAATAPATTSSPQDNKAAVWRAVRDSGTSPGYSSLPGAESGVLIQSQVQYPGSRLSTAGEAWRQVRNQWIIPYGGSLLLIVALAIALFYWRKGPLGGHATDTGRMIERFTPLERAAHWANAIAFVVLAVSGTVMAFGKFFLLPILGHTLFGWITFVLKNAHNFAGPLFAVSLLIVIVTFARDNLPRAGDLGWLLKGGGLFGGKEVPSHRYNAGEKVVFWGGVFVLGLVVVVSGLVLDDVVPGFAPLRGDMQIAHMVHATATVLMVALFMGHIYIGTIGMKGAYDGMRTGYVDEAWAKEHHEHWYDDIQAGKIPAQRSTPVASSVAAPSNASHPA